MAELDLEDLLKPLDAAAPAGPNLEYDPAFLELMAAATAKPERSIGDSVQPAEDPDWPSVVRMALELLGKTKDLRVAVILASAQFRSAGLAGGAQVFGLIGQMLARFWDSVYPQLDAEDNNDPTMRVNSLAPLADPGATLRMLREAPMVSSARAGRFSLRDLRVAQGTISVPAGAAKPELPHIEAAFQDCALEELQATAKTAAQMRDQIQAVDGLLRDKLGGNAPDFSLLLADLKELNGVLSGRLAGRGAAVEGAAAEEGGAAPAGTRRAGGPVASREDVIRRLDEICEYYRRQEPSSPVPILLKRAQRLVNMNFLEIISDLTPSGADQAKFFAGADASAPDE